MRAQVTTRLNCATVTGALMPGARFRHNDATPPAVEAPAMIAQACALRD